MHSPSPPPSLCRCSGCHPTKQNDAKSAAKGRTAPAATRQKDHSEHERRARGSQHNDVSNASRTSLRVLPTPRSVCGDASSEHIEERSPCHARLARATAPLDPVRAPSCRSASTPRDCLCCVLSDCVTACAPHLWLWRYTSMWLGVEGERERERRCGGGEVAAGRLPRCRGASEGAAGGGARGSDKLVGVGGARWGMEEWRVERHSERVRHWGKNVREKPKSAHKKLHHNTLLHLPPFAARASAAGAARRVGLALAVPLSALSQSRPFSCTRQGVHSPR